MDSLKLYVLQEIKRGADIRSGEWMSAIGELLSLRFIERIPGVAEYDYRLTWSGRLALIQEERYLESARAAAE